MDKLILSEINRFREIMGMSLIMEATGPGGGILDLIFGAAGKTGDEFAEALGKNIDEISDPFMREVIEKMKSSIDDNIGEFGGKNADEVLDDISAIARGESRTLTGLDNLLGRIESEILSNPQISQKYLDNFLDTYPAVRDLVNDSERNSLLKSLKDEFPDRYDEVYNQLIDDIENELSSIGVSNNVKNKIINKIDDNIDSSVVNTFDDIENQLDELPDGPDPEIPETTNKQNVESFEKSRQEFLDEVSGLDKEGLKAFLETTTLPNVTKKIEGKGLTELDNKTLVELFYLRQYGILTKTDAELIMTKTVPEWGTIWNSYSTWVKNFKSTNPSFSKWFLSKNKGYSKVPWLKSLSVKTAYKALQVATAIGKAFIGGFGGNIALISWLGLIGTLAGGGYYVFNAAEEITGGQDAGRQTMFTKNNLWKTMFNEFITDTSETIEVYDNNNSRVGEFSILSSPQANAGIDGVDNLEGSLIAWTPENDPIIQTKKPLTLNNVPYYYFILDAPNRLGLEKFGTDYGYSLKAYVNNPQNTKERQTTGITLDNVNTQAKTDGYVLPLTITPDFVENKDGNYTFTDSTTEVNGGPLSGKIIIKDGKLTIE